jgi:RimJ/RimL family protein N-acetyltransferase
MLSAETASGKHPVEVGIRPWSEGDLPLLARLLGDPAMTEHLGGPETPEKLLERHQRYCRISVAGGGGTFVIVLGSGGAAGWAGYWETEWRDGRVWETGWSVLPEYQSHGVATEATAVVAERARAERKHRFMHAFPSVDNGPSNAVCRKAGFALQGEVDIEYPPGRPMRCNDWRLDLLAGDPDSGVSTRGVP